MTPALPPEHEQRHICRRGVHFLPIHVQYRYPLSLRAAFHGQILEPADVGYDQARQIWNASVSKHPAVIARCSGVADVIVAVNFARAKNLPASWRRPQRLSGNSIGSPRSRYPL
jgi:hypothetical protein